MAYLDPYGGPWTIAEAGHLARRAGFGARPAELNTMVTAGMSASVDARVDYNPIDAALDAQIAGLPDTGDLGAIKHPSGKESTQGWWIYRMIHTNQPLQEQFTLFLHDHLVSSPDKVEGNVDNSMDDGNDGSSPNQACSTGTLPPDPNRKTMLLVSMFVAQNNLFRTSGHRPYRILIRAITRDPVMLLYLDNFSNTKYGAQENYAREVMELFTMGVGNYSENDVRQVARAFTGETIDYLCEHDYPYTYVFDSTVHDTGSKTVFGQAFNFPGPGVDTNYVLDLILSRISNSGITPAHQVYPATAIYMAWKFITWFVLESIPISHPAVAELAQVFLNAAAESDIYSVRETLRVLFKSQFFYDPSNVYNMYKHPADYIVMALRNLGIEEDSYSFLVGDWMTKMGMSLFFPPNVAGWNHGTAWINSGNTINRFNYANRVSGTNRMTDVYVDGLIGNGFIASQSDNAGIMEFFRANLIQTALRPEEITILTNFMSAIDAGGGSATSKYRKKVRGMAHLFLTLPQYQLK